MNNFNDQLKNYFRELYTRKNLATELLIKSTKEHHISELSQGIAILDMKIENGLQFLGG